MSAVIPVEREAEQLAKESRRYGREVAQQRAESRGAQVRASVPRMGNQWLADNPDGPLRRAVSAILWWDYAAYFPKPDSADRTDCGAVDSWHLFAALRACGYSECAAKRRIHRPACRKGYGVSDKRGGSHSRMIGSTGSQVSIGIWGMPWTDGNSRARVYT